MIIPRGCWDYAGRRNDFIEWVKKASAVSCFLNPVEVVQWSTDKHYLKDLRDAGVPIAPSEFVEAGEKIDIRQLIKDKGWLKGFIKPIFG